jgi:hypothetical protein
MLIKPVGTPASARTLAWFNEIKVVEGDMASSVFTCCIEIVPTGNVISTPYSVP